MVTLRKEPRERLGGEYPEYLVKCDSLMFCNESTWCSENILGIRDNILKNKRVTVKQAEAIDVCLNKRNRRYERERMMERLGL